MPQDDPIDIALPSGELAGWITESNEPAPKTLSCIDDTMPARLAIKRLRNGEVLLWTGDYHNGRQLLKAIQKRLGPSVSRRATTLADRWQEKRRKTSQLAQVLGRLVVAIESDGSLALRRAPDTREAVTWAWELGKQKHLLPLRTLIGALGSAGWRRQGVKVTGLEGLITPWYGVFSPTRQVYITLLDELDDIEGLSVLDVGCGTGVLSFVLLQRGAKRAVGTDIDLRAVRCAESNAKKLGLSRQFQAIEADLFVPGERFDRVVFNAPWMLGKPATRLDHAIFDEGGKTLHRWLNGLHSHLTPNGLGILLISDLPERLGLRAEDAIEKAIQDAGLQIHHTQTQPARHSKTKDASDPLHEARSSEQIRFYALSQRQSSAPDPVIAPIDPNTENDT